MSAEDHHDQSMFERFLHSQVGSSAVLVTSTVIALIWANSQWAEFYHHISEIEVGITWGELVYKHSLEHWIKDGLMAIFFFVVGLEIKRELVVGELSSFRKAVLPVAAAVGGAVTPALIYVYLNAGGEGIKGWGVPMATDIAFALGVLALFGRRVPVGLKVFLMALAIADDMFAVLVIALFYTADVNIPALVTAGVLLAVMVGAVRLGFRALWIYILLGIGVWAATEASGIHATVAGVLIALIVPVKAMIEPEHYFRIIKDNIRKLESSRLTRKSLNTQPQQRMAANEIYMATEDLVPPGIALEHALHPVQSFLILPLFALFSAGVALSAETLESFPGPVSLGIVLGLVVGKQVGILAFSALALTIGGARLPEGVTWLQLWGVSALAGIGFTMSIFISELAFVSEILLSEAKIAILLASVTSGIIGALILARALPRAS